MGQLIKLCSSLSLLFKYTCSWSVDMELAKWLLVGKQKNNYKKNNLYERVSLGNVIYNTLFYYVMLKHNIIIIYQYDNTINDILFLSAINGVVISGKK